MSESEQLEHVEVFKLQVGSEPPDSTVDSTSGEKEEKAMPDDVTSLLTAQLMGGLNAATNRRVDGADAYAENARMSYLIGKEGMNVAQSLGFRTATESGSGRVRELGPRPAA